MHRFRDLGCHHEAVVTIDSILQSCDQATKGFIISNELFFNKPCRAGLGRSCCLEKKTLFEFFRVYLSFLSLVDMLHATGEGVLMILSASLSSVWAISFGRFACLPGLFVLALCFFFSPFLGCFLLMEFGRASSPFFLGSKVFFFQFCDVASS
jgi:hypothetical protein